MDIIDGNTSFRKGLITIVFFNKGLYKEVGLNLYLKLLLVELIFGAELLSNLVATSSYANPEKWVKKDNNGVIDNGLYRQLSFHVPYGILNILFMNSIFQLLYFNFFKQYQLLKTDSSDQIIQNKDSIDIRRIWFGVDKEILYQFTEVTKLYNLFWLIINILLDIAVYIVVNDITITALFAVLFEYFRRFRI